MNRFILASGLALAALSALSAKAEDAKDFTLLRLENLPSGQQNVYPLDGLTFAQCDAMQKQVWALPDSVNPGVYDKRADGKSYHMLDAACETTAKWLAETNDGTGE